MHINHGSADDRQYEQAYPHRLLEQRTFSTRAQEGLVSYSKAVEFGKILRSPSTGTSTKVAKKEKQRRLAYSFRAPPQSRKRLDLCTTKIRHCTQMKPWPS